MDEQKLQALADGQWEKAGVIPPQNIQEANSLQQHRLLAGVLLKLIDIEKLLKGMKS